MIGMNLARRVEENRHPLIFLYSKYDIFVQKGEENGHPLVFLYTPPTPKPKTHQTQIGGATPSPHLYRIP